MFSFSTTVLHLFFPTIPYPATITFSTAPLSGRRVEIVRKTGRVWVTQGTNTAGDGKGLQGATGTEATFLLNSPTKLP